MDSDVMQTVSIVRYHNKEQRIQQDQVIRERCLEIWTQKSRLTRTVCLPGGDEWLALGWCYSAGLIASRSDVLDMRKVHIGRVTRLEMSFRSEIQDNLHGLLNNLKSAWIQDKTGASRVRAGIALSAGSLWQARTMLESQQVLFQATGGTHSAALFGPGLGLAASAEDVGRHNALDKVIGQALGKDLSAGVLLILSSRLNSEMVGKAIQAKIPFLAGVSAPTQAGVELAEQSGMTLVGFLRPGRFNLYTHAWRLGKDS